MKLLEIAKMPTCIGNKHESLLRSYWILELAKEYLSSGVPHKIILEIIEELQLQDHNVQSTAPNGPALSCGADKFQVAENEMSSY
jgi:hypothetical protein